MKKIIYAVVILLPLMTGCGEGLQQIESDYAIRVTGTPGIAFRGTYTFPGASGLPKPVFVDSKVPVEYRGRGVAAMCVFRKVDEKKTLKVEILKAGTILDSQETSEPFGVITMGKMPNREGMINFIIGRILNVLNM